jgi:hypothetical protein
MNNTIKKDRRAVSVVEVQERGRALQRRFRLADIPHYTRWFVDKEPKWNGDGSVRSRIRAIFNGKGSTGDIELVEKCEALADRCLGPQQAA